MTSDNSWKSLDNGKGMSNSTTKTADTSGSRRSARDASSGQGISSPSSIRKSERLEKRAAPTSPVTRKSERLVKQNTPSPLRRSNRGKIHNSSSPLGLKQSEKRFSSLDAKKKKEKKEKSIKQLTMESIQVTSSEKHEQESISLKRKRMDARSYRALFKTQRRSDLLPDSGDKLEKPDALPQPESAHTDAETSDDTVNGQKESSGTDPGSEGIEHRVQVKNKISAMSIESSVAAVEIGKDVCGDKLERLDALPQPESAHINGGTFDDAVNRQKESSGNDPGSESIERYVQVKNKISAMSIKSNVAAAKIGKGVCATVAEANLLASVDLENHDFVANCNVCSKRKRLDYGSPEKELCCCTVAFKWNLGDNLRCENTEDIEAAISSEPGGLKSDANHDLVNPKESLSRCIVDGNKLESSKFMEYWLPVELSNLQLEQYCATLIKNSISLRSYSKTDSVGAIKDTLKTIRQCCDHPYLVDSSLQSSIIKGLPPVEYLDVGIKASGKLQLLDKILSESKIRKLRVLILFQSTIGGIGDILDDLLRQRFGPDSYERVESGVVSSKKQGALSRFNREGSEKFVFLLEKRCCYSSIKLLAVDIIVIFDSESNPANDLRALQRISIDSQREHINIFRLYTSYSIEEKILILGKKNLNLDTNLQNITRSMSDTLLRWGASCLFSRLDEFHAGNSTTSAADVAFGQSLLDNVVKDFVAVLSDRYNYSDEHDSVISKVFSRAGCYHTNCPLLGERRIQMADIDEPQIFWKKLLEGRNPRWKILHGHWPTPRNRKRVLYVDTSPSKLVAENEEAGNKRRKVGSQDAESIQPHLEKGQVAGSLGEASVAAAANKVACGLGKLNVHNATNSFSHESSFPHLSGMNHPEVKSPSDEQNSLHVFLIAEMESLCKILSVSKDVKHMVGRFLGYVLENHHINKEPASILQAFQMSLCWIAASMLKQKIDRKGSLKLAKENLNFHCTEEEANSVYVKLRLLKKTFMQLSGSISDSISSKNFISAGKDIAGQPSNAGESLSFSFNPQNVKVEFEERSLNQEHSKGQAPTRKIAENNVEKRIKKIQKKCDKRMAKLRLKCEEEVREFRNIWIDQREKLVKEHELELALIRSIHGNSAMGMDKLKVSENEFAKRRGVHESLKHVQLKGLEVKHSAEIEEERKKSAKWLSEAKSCCGHYRVVDDLHIRGSESEDEMGFSVAGGPVTCKGQKKNGPLHGQHEEEQNLDKILQATQSSDAILSDVPEAATDGADACSVAAETLLVSVRSISQKELETSSCTPRVEEPKEVDHSSQCAKEIASVEIPTYKEQIADVPENVTDGADACSVPAEILLSPLHRRHVDEQTLDKSVQTTQSTDAVLSDVPDTATDGAVAFSLHDETLLDSVRSISEKELVTSSFTPRVEEPKEIDHSSHAAEEIASVEISTYEEQIADVPEIVTDGADACSAPTETLLISVSSISEKELETSSFTATVEEPKVNDSSQFDEEIASVEIPTYKEQTADEMDQTNEFPCPGPGDPGSGTKSHAVDTNSMVESHIGKDKENTVSSNVKGNQEDPRDSSTSKGMPPAELQPIGLVVSLPRDRVECLENEESMNLEDGTVQIIEKQVATGGIAHSSTVDDEHTLQSHCKTQVIEIREQLQPASEDVAPDNSQPLAAEAIYKVHSRGGNFLQNSETPPQLVDEPVELSQPAVSHDGQDIVLHPSSDLLESSSGCNPADSQPANRSDREPNSELSACLQSTMDSSNVAENAAELPNQAVLQSGRNFSIVERAPNHIPFHQAGHGGSWNVTISSQTDPLQTDLERIRKEIEQAIKVHDSTKLQLKSACEKEIEEMVAQIRGKYEAKLKDAEAAFSLKKTALDSNMNKILMNKILAEAFRSKCMDRRPARISGIQQAVPSSFMQHLHQISLPPMMRHCPVASQPATGQQIICPTLQSTQRSSGTPPIISARPPQIGAITRTIGNARVGGDIRSPAPHLQPFRPPISTASTNILPFPCDILNQPIAVTSALLPPLQLQEPMSMPNQFSHQQNPPFLPPQPPPLPLLNMNQTSSNNRPSGTGGAVPPGPKNSLSSLQLLRDVHSKNNGHLTDFSSNDNAINLSNNQALASLHVGTSSALVSDVVCLSDDDD